MTSISSKNFIWNWGKVSILFIFLVLSSCSDPKEIGSELFSVEVGVNYTDTITVKSSTVLLDSIYADHSNSLVLGSYFRNDVGEIKTSFFSQISNVDSLNADANSVYQSLKLKLVYSFYIGDTNKSQSFTIHQLKDTLKISDPYFTNQEVGYDPNPLASVSFQPSVYKYRSIVGDTVVFDTLLIELNEQFGRKLFDYYKTPTTAVGGLAFRRDFKGLYFRSTNNDKNAAVLSFNPGTSLIELSYLKSPSDTTVKKINYYFALNDFFGGETQTRNTVVEIDRSQSYLPNLTRQGQLIPSENTRNTTYVSAGFKLATLIDLPYLTSLTNDRNIAINKATLEVPIEEGFDLNYMMATLNLAKVNADNTLRKVNGSIVGIAEEGSTSSIASSGYDVPTNSFIFNVTSLVQNIISKKETQTKFMITPIISAQLDGKNGIKMIQPTYAPINAAKVKLKLYYSYVPK